MRGERGASLAALEWRDLEDWQHALAPHYAEAKRMLGAASIPFRTDADDLLRLVGERMGVGDSYRRPEVSVFFGEDGRRGATVADPFFDGEGPARTTCTRCGSCMIGCRVGAKNTLVKNYLHLAERHGTEILPERTVKEIRPLGAEDGSDGYAITSVRSGAWMRKQRETITARGVVIAAGAIGTNTLLARAKHTGMLPRISDRVGAHVRTNSEALLAVTAKDDSHAFADSVAITSSIYPDRNTHIEIGDREQQRTRRARISHDTPRARGARTARRNPRQSSRRQSLTGRDGQRPSRGVPG